MSNNKKIIAVIPNPIIIKLRWGIIRHLSLEKLSSSTLGTP